MAGRETASSSNEARQEPDKGSSLNFKVSPDFKKQFKVFAVAQGISMTDLLKEGYALSKKERQK